MDRYIKKFSRSLGQTLADSIDANADQSEILIFGIEEYSKYASVFILITVISYMLDIWGYATTATITLLAIRHRIGGLHFKDSNICLLISVLLPILIGSLLSPGNLSISLYISIAVFIVAFIIVVLKGPVDTESVRLTAIEKRRYKKEGIFILILLFFACVGLYSIGAYKYSNTITLCVMTIYANLFTK